MKRLPRVMVHVLALDLRDQQTLTDEIEEMARTIQPRTVWADIIDALFVEKRNSTLFDPSAISTVFATVLDLPLCERVDFAAQFDRLLDAQGDLFGTEGQNDPRGDRRD